MDNMNKPNRQKTTSSAIGKKRTLVLGITGGIGSGKSAVSAAFARQGAVVLDADRIGHEALLSEPVRKALVSRWAKEILSDDKTIDRKKIARIVFGETDQSKEDLAVLNSIVHPTIRRRMEREIRLLKRTGIPLVILDAPLLLETGWSDLCDRLVFVRVNQKNRLKRVKKRGWTRKEFLLREKNQISPQEKRKIADYVLDNNEGYEKMEEQVDSLVRNLSAET